MTSTTKYTILFVAACCLSAMFLLACPGGALAATIGGGVYDSEGNALTGAQIELAGSAERSGFGRSPAGAIPPGIIAAVNAVSAAGRFEFDNVAPGRYTLCVVPNDQKHVNSCAPFSAKKPVEVSADNEDVESNLYPTAGALVVLTVISVPAAHAQSMNIFLDSPDGRVFPMEKGENAGAFWVVVPAMESFRVVTAAAGGSASLPAETVRSGSLGAPVYVTVSR